MLRQPRLHRRPHRLHGKAQAGVYRHLICAAAGNSPTSSALIIDTSGLLSCKPPGASAPAVKPRVRRLVGETRMFRATKDIKLPTTITGSLPRPSWYTENLGTRHFLEAMVGRRFREQYEDA